jgi:hypothetical protein
MTNEAQVTHSAPATITATTASGIEFTIYVDMPIWRVKTRSAKRPKIAEKLKVLEVGHSTIFDGDVRNIGQSVVTLKPKKFAHRTTLDGRVQVWRMA